MDKKWIVLFRGINVGGHNILPMKALVALLESIGYTKVKTYIQSGNVVLEAIESNPYPDAEAEPKSLHLSFLSETPTSANLDAMKELAAKAEKLLGVDATGRNWRTVSKLLELASA